mmetsp:Transcript_19812/g.50410  ORF Transcript_19812/g.50410 Transcript_19812/m.50410 type:complete len:84 (+) Transcript_19812:180-431(+)
MSGSSLTLLRDAFAAENRAILGCAIDRLQTATPPVEADGHVLARHDTLSIYSSPSLLGIVSGGSAMLRPTPEARMNTMAASEF